MDFLIPPLRFFRLKVSGARENDMRSLLWFLCFRKQGRDINELIYAFVKKIDLSNLLFIM